MERARATWTDERLDDLSRRVEDGFNRLDSDLRALRTETNGRTDSFERRVDGRFDALEGRMDGRFDALEGRVDGRFDALEGRIDTRFESLERRVDALQRTMLQFGGGLTLAVLATLVSVLATRA